MLAGSELTREKFGGSVRPLNVSGFEPMFCTVYDCCGGLDPLETLPKSIGVVRPSITYVLPCVRRIVASPAPFVTVKLCRVSSAPFASSVTCQTPTCVDQFPAGRAQPWPAYRSVVVGVYVYV